MIYNLPHPITNIVTKGDLITMNLDGTNRQYRVLKCKGNVAQVMGMWDDLKSAYNSTSTTTTFGSTTAQKYEGSTLDTYLNTTWYNTLKDNVKAAIVPENVVQHCYQYYDGPDTANTPTYTYQYQYDWSDSDYENANDVGNVTVGDRNVFALDLKDIFDYFEKVCITSNELNTLFFNQTTAVSNYIWLRSSRAGDSNAAWGVIGNNGYLLIGPVGISRVVRPALNLNLSKIDFTPAGGGMTETETWYLNESVDGEIDYSTNFISNSESFTRIWGFYSVKTGYEVHYISSNNTAYAYNQDLSEPWDNSAYRTITLSSPATGDLLTWLQANAVKQ